MKLRSRITTTSLVLWGLVSLGILPAGATSPTPQGTLPEEVRQDFADGMFQLPPPRPQGLGVSASRTVWRIPVILVAYHDDPLTYAKPDFDFALFDTTHSTPTGSVFDYYRWVSRGGITVIGEVVATVTLPMDRADYGGNAWGLGRGTTPNNSYGALRDALLLCHRNVDWSPFDVDHDGYVDMVWLVHAGIGGETSTDRGDLWSINSRTTDWRAGEPFATSTIEPGTTDRHILIDRFSVLPELSGFHPGARSEIGVYCHEFGHALGLPDLYDTSAPGGGANSGPGNWSLMATGCFGSNGVSPEYPSHIGAWAMQFLGWDNTLRFDRDTSIVLKPMCDTGDIVEFWFQGDRSPEHFLIENRQKSTFDKTLPFEGLIVTHVDEALIGGRLAGNAVNVGPLPGMIVVEADGRNDLFLGHNRGDGTDPFPGALNRTAVDDTTIPNLRSFGGAPTQLALHDMARDKRDMRLSLTVRARGWAAPRDVTEPGYEPWSQRGPAVESGVDADGVGYLARSELRGGRYQVVLRSSASDWQDGFVVSNATAAALDPTLAILPGGDLALVWSDTRGGRSRLAYRARIRGEWTPEYVLVDLPGNCGNPSIAVDRKGLINLAFLYTQADRPQVMFMRFTYRSPVGHPRSVTRTNELPTSPAVAVAPGGNAFITWIDRPDGVGFPSLWFSHFQPDSGVSDPLPLTRATNLAQVTYSAVTDSDGTLHVVWQASGPGVYELHYQRRFESRPPSPRDTVIDQQGAPLQNPQLAIDPLGGLHLVYENVAGDSAEIRYQRRDPVLGWDYRGATVSDGTAGSATLPEALPRSPGEVRVLFVTYPAGQPHLVMRQRSLAGSPIAIALSPARIVTPSLKLGPNPLPRGSAATFSWSGRAGAAPVLDVFDLAGRRLASVAMTRDHDRWVGTLTASELHDLRAGVYFARVRDRSEAAVRWVVLK